MTDQQQQSNKLTKAESARRNGRKSRGAVTDQGRHNSANGNLRHGAYSKRILIDGESAEGYELFKQSYLERFQPADPFEFECVESMIAARWRIRRIESAEACLLNAALLESSDTVDARFEKIDTVHRRAFAVESKVDTLETLTRIQERLHRIYERNYKLLLKSRGNPATAFSPGPDVPLPTSHPSAVPDPASPSSEPSSQPTAPRPQTSGTPPFALFFLLIALSVLARVALPFAPSPQPAVAHRTLTQSRNSK